MPERRIRVTFPEWGHVLEAERGDSLLRLIREAGIKIDTDCGGTGRCKSCTVLVDGVTRAACLYHVMDDVEVVVGRGRADEDYAILLDGGLPGVAETNAAVSRAADAETDNTVPDDSVPGVAGTPASLGTPTEPEVPAPLGTPDTYAIAVDLGTTTVVGKLIELATGQERASFARLNAQRPYGADVISRIGVSQDDPSVLAGLIREQIDQALTTMLVEQGIDGGQVHKLVIAGNTVMSYLLLGLPCRSLGVAPFKPAYRIEGPYQYGELFSSSALGCAVDVLPFISAYVGGDLTAGLIALRGEDDFILMDMGTNGELVFKRGDRLIGTATAAGPAFEGGGIECGSGSTRGAISSVRYEGEAFGLTTIGGAPPTGICGSGILDLMAILIREGFVDKTGFLTAPTNDGRVILACGSPDGRTPLVFFTQKDVRQYQLAKSAVRTGLEILLREMGGTLPARVFLAGGFGQSLDPESAIITGLLPESFRGRVFPLGNSSLSGAVKACLNAQAREAVVAQIAGAQEVNLATHPLFNDLFMEHLSF